jgi:protein TonB
VEFAAMRADDMTMRDEPGAGARRVVALAASLALHLAILLLLFRESTTPTPAVPDAPVAERLIDDARGRAAGAPTPIAFARMPSATRVQVDKPRQGPSRIEKSAPVARRPHLSPAIVQVAEPTPVPPAASPAVQAPAASVSATATRATGASAVPGAAGSGAQGSDIAGSMRRIVFTHRVEPTLPLSYRRSPKDALVVLAVRIDRFGSPRTLRMVRSSGSSELDFAARDAARKSRYAPHLERGKPVAFWALIPYEFGQPAVDVDRVLAEAGFEHT